MTDEPESPPSQSPANCAICGNWYARPQSLELHLFKIHAIARLDDPLEDVSLLPDGAAPKPTSAEEKAERRYWEDVEEIVTQFCDGKGKPNFRDISSQPGGWDEAWKKDRVGTLRRFAVAKIDRQNDVSYRTCQDYWMRQTAYDTAVRSHRVCHQTRYGVPPSSGGAVNTAADLTSETHRQLHDLVGFSSAPSPWGSFVSHVHRNGGVIEFQSRPPPPPSVERQQSDLAERLKVLEAKIAHLRPQETGDSLS